ncbi:hypothetical protein UPYG_G00115860 [Umbra pygmaea]|uniref:Uncharacterized protein n=1 Tax=Umbra pygmaea TaxID=75934 RepID=A0ABD0XP26_UMBPY
MVWTKGNTDTSNNTAVVNSRGWGRKRTSTESLMKEEEGLLLVESGVAAIQRNNRPITPSSGGILPNTIESTQSFFSFPQFITVSLHA